MSDPQCARCRSSMEEGFVVDHTHGGVARPEWASGEPNYSIWTGVRLKGRDRYRVVTYRCSNCGLLESYARTASER